MVEDASKIGRMLFHGGGTFARTGVAVAAQVGEDELIARCQSLRRWEPKLMMHRKRMKEDDRRAGSKGFVSDLSVAAFNVDHPENLITHES